MFAEPAQLHHLHQLLALVWYRSEAVDKPLPVGLQLLVGGDVVELTIKQHALAAARHVGVGEVHTQVAVDTAIFHKVVAFDGIATAYLLFVHIIEFLVLEFSDGLLQNFLIGFISQVLHESALLGTQQIACATDIQILHGQVKAAAQLRECFKSFQPAPRFWVEHAQGRCQQVAERLAVAAPHAPAHLVQVTQTKAMGIINDDGVGVGYINAVFNNSGREQHVVVVVNEAHDYFLEFLRLHLPVPDGYAAVGHVFLDYFGNMWQRTDATAHEVNLTVAAHLEVDGVGNYFGIKGGNLRLHRIAVGWGRAYNAHVACSHQRELQRAGYRRSRHGKGVYIGFQFAQLFFGAHAEFLLLVDDEQPQVVPLHVFAQQHVCAYDNINAPIGKVGPYLSCLLCRAGPRQIVDPYGEVVQAFAECLEMLVSQHCGRNQHSHLLVVGSRLECRTNGHFGFAESHITANQPVHWLCHLHIVLNILCSFILVGCVFIHEACFQLMLHKTVGTEGEAFFLASLGIKPNQVACDIFDALFGLLFQPVPRTSSERAQPGWLAGVRAAVFAYLVERVNGNIHFVVVLIDNADYLLIAPIGVSGRGRHRYTHQSAEFAYSVINVHKKVAGLHLLYLLQGDGHFAHPGTVALEAVFMEAVEYLVVGKEAHA